MLTSKLFPRSMRCDRPEVLELTDTEIRKALQVPPAEHAAANEAEFDRLLAAATPDDLRGIVKALRKRLAGAEFAARTNAETVAAIWRRRG